MAYEPDKSARFVGLERIRGTIDGRHGSLLLQHVGTFEGGVAKAELVVISGTGDLKGTSGSGRFKADPKGAVTLNLSFVEER